MPRRVGSSLTAREEMNRPSYVSSTPKKLGGSPYLIRFRSLRIWAFRFSVDRGIWYVRDISLRTDVTDAGILGM